MKTTERQIPELKRKFWKMRADMYAQMKEFGDALAKLSLEERELHRADPNCTRDIAEEWGIPQLEGDTETVLNRSVWDILPPNPAVKKCRVPGAGLITRLHEFVVNARITLIWQLAVLDEKDFFRVQNAGEKTLELLKWCLSWNGLWLDMRIRGSLCDKRVFIEVRDFFADFPNSDRERLIKDFSRQEDTIFPEILYYSRKGLGEKYKLNGDCLDLIEAKLKSLGRSLRPPED